MSLSYVNQNCNTSSINLYYICILSCYKKCVDQQTDIQKYRQTDKIYRYYVRYVGLAQARPSKS